MKSYHINRGCRKGLSARKGFTLIELLVVIAVIAILAAILLPVLAKSKQSAINLTCLNNERQLELCWHLYIADNNDHLAPNNSIAFIEPGTNTSTASTKSSISWLPDLDAKIEISPSNIISGALYQYNNQLGIYHCPADLSTLQTPDGQRINQPRWRSYNMSQSMNGWPDCSPETRMLATYIPMWATLNAVKAPRPSDAFVFIDENSDCVLDAQFGNPPASENWPVWWDLPSSRHNQGANLSFADGHVDHWKWKTPKIFYDYVQSVGDDEMPDFKRIQNAMKQTWDDEPNYNY